MPLHLSEQQLYAHHAPNCAKPLWIIADGMLRSAFDAQMFCIQCKLNGTHSRCSGPAKMSTQLPCMTCIHKFTVSSERLGSFLASSWCSIRCRAGGGRGKRVCWHPTWGQAGPSPMPAVPATFCTTWPWTSNIRQPLLVSHEFKRTPGCTVLLLLQI